MSSAPLKIREECQSLLRQGGYNGNFILHMGEPYRFPDDFHQMTLTLEGRKTVERPIPTYDLLIALSEFAKKHLVPLVDLALAEPLVKDKRGVDESFANEPLSIGELRSMKTEDGSLRSVRDTLVEVLRKIDSGDPEWQDLKVGVLVFRRRLPGDDTDTVSWRAGGPEYDNISAIGMIQYTAVTMIRED